MTLAAAEVTVDGALDLAGLPAPLQEQIAPHLAELVRRPAPPYRPRSGLADQVGACQAAGLLNVAENDDGEEQSFVHRWTATELAGRASRGLDQALTGVHRQAAAYWQWRAEAWPRDMAADVHDLLEARYHLLRAVDTKAAGEVTEHIVGQLDEWGAWEQEASLIHDTLSWQYQRSLNIHERLGNQDGTAMTCSHLGILEKESGGKAVTAIAWHAKALAIGLAIGAPLSMQSLPRRRGPPQWPADKETGLS